MINGYDFKTGIIDEVGFFDTRYVHEMFNTPVSMRVKMDEEIKTFNKKNLKEAKRLAVEQKNNREVVDAQYAYEALIDAKETEERKIKVAKEKLVEINEDLKIFN